jgi:hypothetical protein
MTRWLALIAAALITGCASTQLEVAIDVYDEDPRFSPPMGPDEANVLIENIERLHQAAVEKTSQRKFLATGSYRLYMSVWNAAGANRTEACEVDRSYEGYLRNVSAALADLEPQLSYAATTVSSYVYKYEEEYEKAATDFSDCETYRITGHNSEGGKTRPKDCRVSDEGNIDKKVTHLGNEWVLRQLPDSLRAEESQVRRVVQEAIAAYRAFASSVATVSELAGSNGQSQDQCAPIASKGIVQPGEIGAFYIDWATLRGRLNLQLQAAQVRKVKAKEQALILALQNLNAGTIALAQASNGIPPDEIASATASGNNPSKSGLEDSVTKIALELEALRGNLPENASAQTALAELVRSSSSFAELIDRLQDAGNPVWRIVTDPANEAHWNKGPLNTNFYAQGKASVVMVRNDPMRFDVHDASNNPTALIKGQLEITRSIASAAISIAGAATGLPAVGAAANSSAKPANAGANPPTTAPSTDTSNDLVKRKATAEQNAQLRAREIRGLSLELSTINAGLAKPNDPVSDATKARVNALVSAYKAAFEPSSK